MEHQRDDMTDRDWQEYLRLQRAYRYGCLVMVICLMMIILTLVLI